MKDAAIIRSNERTKAYSNQLFNLGAALAAAAIVKGVSSGAVGFEEPLWLIGSAALIYSGHGVLGLLDDEEL